jgi:hypothetical protein
MKGVRKLYLPEDYSRPLSVQRAQFTPFWTADQGFAIQMVAFQDISRGHVLAIRDGGSALQVEKNPVDSDKPIGVAYNNAYSGDLIYVVISGLAYVLPDAAITAVQGYVMYSSGTTAGYAAQSASIPATTQHWREFGHFAENGSGDGVLARGILHFN